MPNPGRRPPPVVEVDGLVVRRGDARLLDGVAWRVERGQHWVVLGPNGSGKTCLIKVLCGYLSASEGAWRVLGREHGRADWRDLRTRIGLVSSALAGAIPEHEPALCTVASGRTARLDLARAPDADEAARARRLLASAGAASLAARPWGVLSQGERQRVLIARALMARPALLILDEPCAGLDPVARQQFLVDLDRLLARQAGPAVALVTHHVEEITAGFTHALLLRAGTVVAAGPLRELMRTDMLSTVFGGSVRVGRRAGRWRLSVGDQG